MEKVRQPHCKRMFVTLGLIFLEAEPWAGIWQSLGLAWGLSRGLTVCYKFY